MSKDPAYIQRLYQAAVKATQGTGLLPDTLVTQHILESGMKLSTLAVRANNFFGIKAGTAWPGRVISAPTSEYIDGRAVRIPGNWKIYPNRAAAIADKVNPVGLFRVYDTEADGLRGWVEFLQTNKRYAAAGLFTAKTAPEQFAALARAGYATDPQYLTKLSRIYQYAKDFFF